MAEALNCDPADVEAAAERLDQAAHEGDTLPRDEMVVAYLVARLAMNEHFKPGDRLLAAPEETLEQPRWQREAELDQLFRGQ